MLPCPIANLILNGEEDLKTIKDWFVMSYCCDDLNQAPAMADHHHQRPTDKSSASVAAAAGAGATYPPKLINDAKAFIYEMLAELKEAPDVQRELISLLSGLGKHGGDADAVRSRAADLLRGHPDVLRRFIAWIRLDSALAFVKLVHETAGPVVHDRFLAVLSEARGSEGMAADEVYDRAKRVFGPAHVGLLHMFATVWLPGEEEWKLQQQARARRAAAASSHAAAAMPGAKKKPRADDDGNARRHDPAIVRRQHNRAAAASHAAVGVPGAKKKPRGDDGNNGRRHDHVIAVLEARNVNKGRRSDDDGTGRGCHALRGVGDSPGGGAAAQARDDDYEYAPRSRRKKPRGGNGESSGSAAAARVLGAAAAPGVHHAYSDNDKKPPRRRATNGGKSSSAAAAAGPKQQLERDDEARRFRQEWEFQTCYSKLVATSDRVTELLRSPHGDDGGGGGGNRSMEVLFPLPECREFLHNYYGDRWGQMRAALQRGESRVPALEAIARSLTTKEEEAVVEESRKRCRHDPVRAAQRLHGLAVHTLDEECRRHHGGGA